MLGRSVLQAVALVLAAAVLRPAAGQTGKLAGIVTDAATGEPLAGVQITVEGTGRSVLTQPNGRYFLINIPAGTYTVVAELLGYATVRRENVQISIDVTRTLDFQMTTQALAIDELERASCWKRFTASALETISALSSLTANRLSMCTCSAA